MSDFGSKSFDLSINSPSPLKRLICNILNLIKLGETSPHLHIIFNSGKILFINGYHEKYECWQAGDGHGFTGDEWLVVAVPQNGIATWILQK